MQVDLNADMGEGFGIYRVGEDEALLQYVTSANIACGFHAGDPSVIRRTVQLCLQRGVAVGAHPGLPDLVGFGRREMAISPEEVGDLVLYQVGALKWVTEAEGGRLHHVKPHGALYNMAVKRKELAEAIVGAIRLLDPKLMLYAPPGSCLAVEAERAGIRCAFEAFADRSYRADGTLVPRGEPGAVIQNTEQAVAQAMSIVRHGRVNVQEGTQIPLRGDTICIHGDGENALELARALRTAFERDGVSVRPPGEAE